MKFICDFMLGNLSKYLRMCNFDTIFIKNIEDDELIKRAFDTNRILLTRDRRLSERRIIKEKNIKTNLLKSNCVEEQIKQIEDILKITFNLDLKRCIRCNEPLYALDKEKIKDLVPSYIYKMNNTFLQCSCCKKIYWKGTHVDKMRNFFNSHLSGRI